MLSGFVYLFVVLLNIDCPFGCWETLGSSTDGYDLSSTKMNGCIKLNRVQVYVLYHNMQTLSSLYCFGYWKSFFGKAEGRQKEIVDLVFLWKSLKCFLVFHIVLFNTDSGWLHRKFRKENKLKKKKEYCEWILVLNCKNSTQIVLGSIIEIYVGSWIWNSEYLWCMKFFMG